MDNEQHTEFDRFMHAPLAHEQPLDELLNICHLGIFEIVKMVFELMDFLQWELLAQCIGFH